MGLDPDDDDYEADLECVTCVDVAHGGVTPRYIWAHVSGVINCPPATAALNGSFKLEQTLNPCNWGVIYDPNNGMRYELFYRAAPTSRFTVATFPDGFLVFLGTNVNPCIDRFDNELTCPGFLTEDGHAILTWGPDDPC